MWAGIINMILGMLLMAAPSILEYGDQAANSNYITGPIIFSVALVSLSAASRNARWLNMPAGAWIAVSPVVFAMIWPAAGLNAVTGLLVMALSLVKRKTTQSFGGGWRSLLRDNPEHMQDQ